MDEAKNKISKLVEKYGKLSQSGLIKKYNEEETKKDFILPLFEALGWDVYNKQEVSAEEQQSGGRVDYGFYINGRAKFYLEAKQLSVDLHREEFANQAIRYSWNKGMTWAVLTDFESIKVFNAQDIEKYLSDKLFFEIPHTDYLNRFDQLWLLSREAFQQNLIDKEAEKVGKKLQKVSVTSMLYKDLDECRQILTRDLSQWNDKVSPELIDEGVQKIIDRLIFLRVAEDRGLEPPTLKPLIRDWENRNDKSNVPLYKSMIVKFREFDAVYNSNLFSPHPFEEWDDYSKATEKVIDILYGKKGYYEYDFKAMPADVLGTVYENYLGYRLSRSRKVTTVNKDDKKRKEQGIYYTPDFIVDYIVKGALKPILDKCQSVEQLKKIKILDPACGSGSFLLKAFQLIKEKYKEFGYKEDVFNNLTILIDNVFGVDLDPQAVEIARLNLLISALDQRIKLPHLSDNIKNGNSLISGDEKELTEYFGKTFKEKKPFNWQEEFPQVFKLGGFDVVIGNPPYIRVQTLAEEDKNFLKSRFVSASGNYDIYVLFIEMCLSILKAGGEFGMILPNKFLENTYGEKIRSLLYNDGVIRKIVDLGEYQVFQGATTYSALLFLQKTKKESFEYLKINNTDENLQAIGIDASIKESSTISYKSANGASTHLGSETNGNLLQKITNGHQKLQDVTTRIFQGLKTSADDIYVVNCVKNDGKVSEVVSPFNRKTYLLESAILHPLIKGTEMRTNQILPTNKAIIFPYSQDGKIITKENLKSMFPKTYDYFEEVKDNLERRERGRFSGGDYYQYGRNQALDIIGKPKIITPDIAPHPRFSFDSDGKYFFTGGVAGGYGLLVKTEMDPFYLLAVLNSKVLEWYLRQTSSQFRGGFYSYESRFIKNLPIVQAENKSSLSTMSAKMASIQMQLIDTANKSDSWRSLKRDKEDLTKEMDQLIYLLYGLADAEIQIIETEISD